MGEVVVVSPRNLNTFGGFRSAAAPGLCPRAYARLHRRFDGSFLPIEAERIGDRLWVGE